MTAGRRCPRTVTSADGDGVMRPARRRGGDVLDQAVGLIAGGELGEAYDILVRCDIRRVRMDDHVYSDEDVAVVTHPSCESRIEVTEDHSITILTDPCHWMCICNKAGSMMIWAICQMREAEAEDAGDEDDDAEAEAEDVGRVEEGPCTR